MKVGDLPVRVLSDLERRGWKPEMEITPEQAFDEYCEWHGLINWGPTLRSVMDEIKEVTE